MSPAAGTSNGKRVRCYWIVGIRPSTSSLVNLLRAHQVDIAGARQAGIVGHEVTAEEVRNILIAGRGQVVRVADHRPGVRVRRRVERFREHLLGEPVWRIVVALAPFVRDDVPLSVHTRLRYGVQQLSPPVGFDEEHQLQRI